MGALPSLPLVVGGALGLAGYGVYKGMTDVGGAARGVGRGAEVALLNISGELTQLRRFLQETAWPEFNKTLVRFRGVLDTADVFLNTSTFTVKVLALLLALCAAYVTHKLLITEKTTAWNRRRIQNTLAAVVENTILQVVYCLCLVLAVVLVLQLVKDLFDISWPHSVPFVVLIPSVTTLAILYQHLVSAVKAIISLLRLIPYIMIEVPVNMGYDPVVKGASYMRSVPLQLGMCIIYFTLYCFIPYGAYLLVDYLVQSEESLWKRAVIAYVVFYATAMLINVTATLMISHLVRPVWAFLVRRNFQGR